MKSLLCLILLAISSLPALAAKCPEHHAKNPDVLVEIERSWATALENHDVAAVGCILADDFQDADPNGAVHGRAEALAQVPHRRSGKNILSELTPRIFGDVGYIRGLATLVNAEGNAVAKVRFTDIYVYRGHRWVAVAAQETLLPDAAK